MTLIYVEMLSIKNGLLQYVID